MARKNRTCICCKDTYPYCPTCGGPDAYKPAWYANYCSEDCKTLWETATKFNMELATKQEAAEIINGLALKERSQYAECIQRDLKNILTPEAPRAQKFTKNEVVNKK